MKGLLRRPRVQAVLGWMVAGYLRLILRTVRWRHVNLQSVEPMLAGEGGALVLLWHGRIPVSLSLAPHLRRRPERRVLISPSSDGEFLAQALARCGFPAIRMSSAKKGDAAKARAAVAGFRESLKLVGDGGVLVITPDGPRGPNEVIAPGALQIARRAQAPVYLAGIAAAPALSLNTWDRVMVARPFGRGAVVWVGPLLAPEQADETQMAALGAQWSAALSAATRQAEALVGSVPAGPRVGAAGT
ncbi:MAG: lysophospholipid acyltransferase family protein [Phenylobacterium sp.]|uniref:lysophospholipid acyltransferase family protein n=1 Tax=Phenylobacterium sp. TaxID=1871053 RepID=UPI002723E1E0|nr:lysophospholipid acyltransferase family protein [Phenylobacterium sp.]MDO8900605.1 lysophospholipid acyltransferase family protein [Phenylobacterium sp.]